MWQSFRISKCFLALLVLVLLIVASRQGFAIPAFSRLYGTSCSTCHIDFPKLNDFGKAFKDAGFKFPKDDESMLKIPPVMLEHQPTPNCGRRLFGQERFPASRRSGCA